MFQAAADVQAYQMQSVLIVGENFICLKNQSVFLALTIANHALSSDVHNVKVDTL